MRTEDRIVAVLPGSKLKEATPDKTELLPGTVAADSDHLEKPAMVQSDVLLIDTNSVDYTYHVSMNLTKVNPKGLRDSF